MEVGNFENLIECIKENREEFLTIDLRDAKLTLAQLEDLRDCLDNFRFLGEVLFKDASDPDLDDNKCFTLQIEIKIAVKENNLKFLEKTRTNDPKKEKAILSFWCELVLLKKQLNKHADSVEIIELLTMIANKFTDYGSHSDALKFKLEALEMKKRLLKQTDNREVAKLLNSVGFTYLNLKKISRALSAFKESLGMSTRLHKDEDHLNKAASLFGIGEAYHAINELNKALEYKSFSLKMYKTIFKGEDHFKTVKLLNSLASTYLKRNEHVKAVELHKVALGMKKRLLSMDTNELVADLHNIASVYAAIGDSANAFDFYREAVDISKRISEPNDSLIIVESLQALGDTFFLFKRFNEALECFLQSFSMRERLSAEKEISDEEMKSLLMKLYNTCKSLSEFENALKYYNRVFDVLNRTVSSKELDKEYIEYYINVAILYSEIGQFEKAVEFYEEALNISSRLKIDDSEKIGMLLNNIGIMHANLKQFNLALEYQLKYLELRKLKALENIKNGKEPGEDIDFATLLMNVGVSYEKLGQFERSLEFKLQCLDLYKKLNPGDNALNANVLNNIANTYSLAENVNLKIQYKIEALEMRKRLREKGGMLDSVQNDKEILRISLNLGKTYQKIEDHSKAIEFYLVARAYMRRMLEARSDLYPELKEHIKKCLVDIIDCYAKLSDQVNVNFYQEEFNKLRYQKYTRACVVS